LMLDEEVNRGGALDLHNTIVHVLLQCNQLFFRNVCYLNN
jgi:hypothetical protein